MWGCSDILASAYGHPAVFPTHVGMFRKTYQGKDYPSSFPHACGDVPRSRRAESTLPGFSPRMWGCSAADQRRLALRQVFPTHVGMFRSAVVYISTSRGFPHACGDVPMLTIQLQLTTEFSPRMWGCSGHNGRRQSTERVFPTHVGMFLSERTDSMHTASFPHACGDVPFRVSLVHLERMFSPRMWGCSGGGPHDFLGSTRFPHACGDVPLSRRGSKRLFRFSPRMWGCSAISDGRRQSLKVFPTHVGMFLR